MAKHECDVCGGAGTVSEPTVDTTVRKRRGRLERGWQRQWLIGMLARGEGSCAALATSLGCSTTAVLFFRDRHSAEIEAERTRMTDELSRLWIADKLSRLAELQSDVDDLNDVIQARLMSSGLFEEGADLSAALKTLGDIPLLIRTKLAILHEAAEQLGQLPGRVQVQVGEAVVTYKIEGVDLDQV